MHGSLAESVWDIATEEEEPTIVHLHKGILYSRKKEGAPTLCDSTDAKGEHYAK